MARRVTCVILAGGDSKRFGSDKAFAPWRGRPFLDHVVRAIQGVSDALIVLGRTGADPRAYAALAPGATILLDRRSGGGPVEAVNACMELIRTPTVLVVPCDAPGLPTGLARRLVALCEELGRPAVAQLPSGPLWDLFAIPKELLRARLGSAHNMEDLLQDAELVETDADGLNVNEPLDAS